MRDEKGITLTALVVTIIVVVIIAGITITTSTKTKANIKKAGSDMMMTELSEVQQAVLETYIKYKQTGNSNSLVGNKIQYGEAESKLKELSSTFDLKASNYDSQENVNVDMYYYQLTTSDLEKIGIKKSEQEYIVNYSTGEVFNYLTKVTKNGDLLYVYVDGK